MAFHTRLLPLALKVTGSGVNFCSTCVPTVYPLARPTLSQNDEVLMMDSIDYSSLFPALLSFLSGTLFTL